MFLMMRKKETLACEQTPAVNKKASCDGVPPVMAPNRCLFGAAACVNASHPGRRKKGALSYFLTPDLQHP